MSIITRAEYMEQPNKRFEEFYAQFVTSGTIWAAERALAEYPIALEIDGHFNDMPVTKWDRFAENLPHNRANYNLAYPDMNGRVWKSDLVCILKVAAIKIMESRGWRKIWRDNPHGYTEMRLRKRTGLLKSRAIDTEGQPWEEGQPVTCVQRFEQDGRTWWKATMAGVAWTAKEPTILVEEESIRPEEPVGWKEIEP